MNPLKLNFYPIRLQDGSIITAFFDGADFFADGEVIGHTDLAAYHPTPVAQNASGQPDNVDALTVCTQWVDCNDQFNHPSAFFEPLPFMLHADREHPDVIYLEQSLEILRYGHYSHNRTNTDTITINSARAKMDFRKGSPLLTTKFMNPANVFEETKWMLSGESDLAPLHAGGCHIWDEWATKEGKLGPVYGAMWRHWPDRRMVSKDEPDFGATIQALQTRGFGIEYDGDDVAVMFREVDQVASILNTLKTNPTCRRMRLTGLNPSFTPYADLTPSENAEIGQQALPPCHVLYHVLTAPIPQHVRRSMAGLPSATKEQLDAAGVPALYLDMNLYQASADFFLGAPYNRKSAFAMMSVFAELSNMVPRFFTHDTGSTHFYVNHIKQILTQMEQPIGAIAQAKVNVTSLDNITSATLDVTGYVPGIKLKGKVAV